MINSSEPRLLFHKLGMKQTFNMYGLYLTITEKMLIKQEYDFVFQIFFTTKRCVWKLKRYLSVLLHVYTLCW